MWNITKLLYRPRPPAPLGEQPEYDPSLEPPPLGDVIRRGEAAHRLLNDPTLAEAFAELRADSYRQWIDSKPADAPAREELYRITQALELVRGKLIAYRGAAQVRVAERDAA